MKTEPFRLTIDVDFDPQGVSREGLQRNLNRLIQDAVNNGTLTGDSPATVEHYSFKISRPPTKKRSVKTCKQCGTPLTRYGYCRDMMCPFSDHLQSTSLESLYEPKQPRI